MQRRKFTREFKLEAVRSVRAALCYDILVASRIAALHK